MPLTRTTHWATRELNQFLIDHKKDKFVWGKCDCCLIAADAILAMTSVDIADDFRGKYTDQASAFALIKSVTGGSTVAAAAAWCASKHGLVEWTNKAGKPLPLMAQRGDLVVVQQGVDLIAGFVHLDGKHAVSIGDGGLKYLSMSRAVRAWKV